MVIYTSFFFMTNGGKITNGIHVQCHDWLNHGPTTNGLITGNCLWSHHDRRHLIMCILMSTFMCHDTRIVTDKRTIYFTSNSFRWSAISGYVSWLKASDNGWWGAANPKLWQFLWYKIDYYRSGHWRTCIWPCLTVRNACPLDLYCPFTS